MKVTSACLVLLAATANAFMPAINNRAFVSVSPMALRMSSTPDEAVTSTPPASTSTKSSTSSSSSSSAPTSSALVPIKEETVEFTAGILGGLAGFIVGGPVLGAIVAAAANYVSKIEGDATDVIQAVSKSSIQIYNYLTTLDGKYELLKKAQDSLQNALDKLKNQESVDKSAVAKVEGALASTQAKIAEINDEYDLVGGSLTALGVVGDLVEKAIDKVGEINAEYKLSDKALASLKSAIERAKEAASRASA